MTSISNPSGRETVEPTRTHDWDSAMSMLNVICNGLKSNSVPTSAWRLLLLPVGM